MIPRLILRHRPGEVEILAIQGGRLADYRLWRPGAPDGWGDLHAGRITARVPSLAGSFVELAHEQGFLPDRETDGTPPEGTLLPVRVTRAAQGGKGPRLTARLDPTPDKPNRVALIERGPTPLDDVHALFPEATTETYGPTTDLDPAIDDAVDALRAREIALPGGARASFWPTPALVAIDVDTAAATATRQTAQFAINRALLPRLLHEIRLRNLSGAILLDLAGLTAAKRAALRPAIERALSDDPLRPRLLGFTALGLAEIVRARRRPPLHELLSSPYSEALDAAAALARAASSHPARRLMLRAAPPLATILEHDDAIASDLARALSHPLIVRSDPSIATWRLEEPK